MLRNLFAFQKNVKFMSSKCFMKYNMYRLVVPPNNSNTPIIGYILPNIAKTKEISNFVSVICFMKDLKNFL